MGTLKEYVPSDEQTPFRSGHSLAEAARLLGLPSSQIREFVRAEFLAPRRGPKGEYRFSFQDLVLLRTARDLSRKLSPQKVKRALRSLKRQLPRGRQLSTVRLTAEGDEVVVRDGRASWDPLSGQTFLNFEVSELAIEVAPLVRQAAEEARDTQDDLDAEDWYDLGCELEHCDLEEARDAYRRTLELDPAHPDAHLNLGRLLHEAGEVAAAERHYRMALDARPEDTIAAYNLGVALEDAGHRREAVEAYELAIALDPENADAHFNLAQLYEQMGEARRALRHYQTCVQLRDPADPAPRPGS